MKGLKYYDKGIISPRFMLILPMTIFGTLGLFVRNIPVSSEELALYRAVSAAMLIFIYLKITRQKIPFQKIKKESLCFLMSTLGLVLLTGVGDTNGKSNLTGIAFGLGAAFFATVILLNKFIKLVDGIYRTFLQFLSAILSYIDPFVAVLVSVFLLGESITLLQGLGGALILGFTCWNEISPSFDRKKKYELLISMLFQDQRVDIQGFYKVYQHLLKTITQNRKTAYAKSVGNSIYKYEKSDSL